MGVTDCFRPRDDGEGSGGFLSLVFKSDSDPSTAAAASSNNKSLFDTSELVKDLSTKLDIDIMGRNFGRFAGGDQLMDPEEYVADAAHEHLPTNHLLRTL